MKVPPTLSGGEKVRAVAVLSLVVVLLIGCRGLDTGTGEERDQGPEPVKKENRIIQERWLSHAGNYSLVLERPERLSAAEAARVRLDIRDARGGLPATGIVVTGEVVLTSSRGTSSPSVRRRLPVELRSRGQGRYEVAELTFPEAGTWVLRVDITAGAVTERAIRRLSVD